MSSMACLNIEIPKKPANKTASEHRRATKPIMEKRRRARINHSLNELKSLILDALNRDPTRNSKLEKADILEMTVKHLQSLQRQQMALEAARDPGVLSKYKAGFSECASEVSRYVNKIDGVDGSLKQRLVSHLNNCIQSLPASPTPAGVFSGQGTIAFPGMTFPSGASPSPLQVHIPVGHHHLFSTSSSSASSTSSAVNLTTTASDINNNLHRRSENTSETSKLTPPASATSAFSFSFPSVTSSLSPVTPSTPSTPGFTTAADFRFAPYKISVHPWSHHHHHRRDVLRSVSPGSSSSMGSLSPTGSDSVDCESIASSSDKNCSGSDVWRPW